MWLSYPMYVELANKKCVVVGGGRVAQRKVEELLSTGAQIRLISPEARKEIQELAEEEVLQWERREFEPKDLEGAFLAFAATDREEVNRRVAKEAHKRGALVNVADLPELCDFLVPSIVRRGDLTIAISTKGASPALAKRLRLQLERTFGLEYETYLVFLAKWREDLKERVEPQAKRAEVLKAIINSDCLELIRSSEFEKAHARVEQIIEEYTR